MNIAAQGRTPVEIEFWRALIAVAKNPELLQKHVEDFEAARVAAESARNQADAAEFAAQSASAQAMLDRDRADRRIAEADEYAAAAKRDVTTARDQAASEAAAVAESQRLEAERLKTWDGELTQRARDLAQAENEARDIAAHASELAVEHKDAIAKLDAATAAANERERVASEATARMQAVLAGIPAIGPNT